MKKIQGAELERVSTLFNNMEDTSILSCLQGIMGSCYVVDSENPKSAIIICGCFCFLAGEPCKELVEKRVEEYPSHFLIMIPENEPWEKLIENYYQRDIEKYTRYAIKKEGDIFDREKLEGFVSELDSEYELRMIDEELYYETRKNPWSEDFCGTFQTYEDYAKWGLGVVILHKGEIVAGASSYSGYRQGIEVEIVTREDYRRRGLATVCGAKLILECLERGKYPSWDAANLWSVALSKKLGYHFDHEYTAYKLFQY